ncbi:MAG: hypothetical protein HY791_01070 [Deltaproteobacteria bacterium]|nr:hypothetical protein [Deltaproteobacteria bacterium]
MGGAECPTDNTAPVVAIGAPEEDAVVLMQQAVTGTVRDDNLLSYAVELERQGHPGSLECRSRLRGPTTHASRQKNCGW